MNEVWIIPYLKAQQVFSIIWSAVPSPVRTFAVLALSIYGGIALLDILTTRT